MNQIGNDRREDQLWLANYLYGWSKWLIVLLKNHLGYKSTLASLSLTTQHNQIPFLLLSHVHHKPWRCRYGYVLYINSCLDYDGFYKCFGRSLSLNGLQIGLDLHWIMDIHVWKRRGEGGWGWNGSLFKGWLFYERIGFTGWQRGLTFSFGIKKMLFLRIK